MDIGTESADRIVNVGSAASLYSLYSTASALLGRQARKASLALSFLETGECGASECAKAAKQLAAIGQVLEEHAPEEAVWDKDRPKVLAPWAGKIALDVTSCADLYTTAEGEPMLPALISLVKYADSTQQSIVALG